MTGFRSAQEMRDESARWAEMAVRTEDLAAQMRAYADTLLAQSISAGVFEAAMPPANTCPHGWEALRSVPPSWLCRRCGTTTETRPDAVGRRKQPEADSPCAAGCRPSQGDVCGGPRCT